MKHADELKRKAEACLRISSTCFDLDAARRLRRLAEEMKALASQMDDGEYEFQPHIMKGNGSHSGDLDRN